MSLLQVNLCDSLRGLGTNTAWGWSWLVYFIILTVDTPVGR